MAISDFYGRRGILARLRGRRGLPEYREASRRLGQRFGGEIAQRRAELARRGVRPEDISRALARYRIGAGQAIGGLEAEEAGAIRQRREERRARRRGIFGGVLGGLLSLPGQLAGISRLRGQAGARPTGADIYGRFEPLIPGGRRYLRRRYPQGGY